SCRTAPSNCRSVLVRDSSSCRRVPDALPAALVRPEVTLPACKQIAASGNLGILQVLEKPVQLQDDCLVALSLALVRRRAPGNARQCAGDCQKEDDGDRQGTATDLLPRSGDVQMSHGIQFRQIQVIFRIYCPWTSKVREIPHRALDR